MPIVYTALVEIALLMAAALAMAVLVCCWLLLSTAQQTVFRRWRQWHRDRPKAQKDAAYQRFRARYDPE